MTVPLQDPDDDDPLPAFADPLAPEAVRALEARSVRRGLTSGFQSLLAALVEDVADVVVPVRAAAAAAINLAQQRHVAAVADGLDAALDALRGGLSDQGRALLTPPPRARDALRALVTPRGLRRAPAALAWGPAMEAAEGSLGEAADYAATLAAAQPDGSSARVLGEALAARLRHDRGRLVAEVARTAE